MQTKISRLCHAFTLLELSVVLVIVSLVAGMGISLSRNINNGSDRILTQQRLQVIQTALDAYEKQYGYLPCPASRTLKPSDAGFGQEVRGGTYRCTTGTPSIDAEPRTGMTPPVGFIGAVPTQSLGIPSNFAADAWGNKFLYAVSYKHLIGEDSYFDNDGQLTVRSGNLTAYSPISTTVSYVVLSHGADGKGAYPYNGSTIGTSCGAITSGNSIDNHNCDAIVNSTTEYNIFYDADFSDATPGANYFDDYIVWRSNRLNRAPVATAATSGYGGYNGSLAGTGCNPGVCEAWCAPCFNAPVYTSDPNATKPMQIYVCQSAITSYAPSCSAKCVYGYVGTDSNAVTHNEPCK